MVGAGVIGCGSRGVPLVRALTENESTTVIAVCDRDPARVRAVRERYPALDGRTDFHDVIADDRVDLVVVATPVRAHFSMARAAVLRGKHVLVTPPLAHNAAAVEELIELAERAGVLVAVDHPMLFAPAVEKIKELIEGGALGALMYIDSVHMTPGAIRDDVSVLWDLAPDDLAIISSLLEEAPDGVRAVGSTHAGGGQVDVAYLSMDFGYGLLANLHVNWLGPAPVCRMIFGGDRKTIVFDALAIDETIRVYDTPAACRRTGVPATRGREDEVARLVSCQSGDIWIPGLPKRDVLAAEVHNVATAVTSGRALRTHAGIGLRIVRLLEAGERSLRNHGGRILTSRTAPADEVRGGRPVAREEVSAAMAVPYAARTTERLPWPPVP